MSHFENLASKLDRIETSINRIIDSQRDFGEQITKLTEDQNKFEATLDSIEKGIENLNTKMEQLERPPLNQQNHNFPQEMITQAWDQLGLDLNIELVSQHLINIFLFILFNFFFQDSQRSEFIELCSFQQKQY